jgi:hypothetical protein
LGVCEEFSDRERERERERGFRVFVEQDQSSNL